MCAGECMCLNYASGPNILLHLKLTILDSQMAYKLVFYDTQSNNLHGTIFLKLGNHSITTDHVSTLFNIEWTSEFQSLSLRDQKLKSIYNQILYAFETFLLKMFVKSTSANFNDQLV